MPSLLTQKTVKFIGIAGIVILAIGGGTLIIQPTIGNIQTQASTIQSAKDQVSTIMVSKDTLSLAKANYSKVSLINKALLKQFPSLANIPELMTALSTGATESGMSPSDISSITFAAPAIQIPVIAPPTTTKASKSSKSSTPPAAPTAQPAAPAAGSAPTGSAGSANTTVSTGDFATMDVGISVDGTPHQIQEFLNYINKMNRVMIVSAASITVAPGKTNMDASAATLSITGTTYIYRHIQTPAELNSSTTNSK